MNLLFDEKQLSCALMNAYVTISLMQCLPESIEPIIMYVASANFSRERLQQIIHYKVLTRKTLANLQCLKQSTFTVDNFNKSILQLRYSLASYLTSPMRETTNTKQTTHILFLYHTLVSD